MFNCRDAEGAAGGIVGHHWVFVDGEMNQVTELRDEEGK